MNIELTRILKITSFSKNPPGNLCFTYLPIITRIQKKKKKKKILLLNDYKYEKEKKKKIK